MPLAVTTATRSETLPDVPAASDFVPGYEAGSWFGIVAPRGTSAGIVNKLNKEVNAALESPHITARLAELGASVTPGSPDQFGDFIAQETDKYAGVIRTAGIKQ